MDLSYIIEKIRNTEFSEHPFRHLEIYNLFKDEDLQNIINSPEIKISAKNDEDLFDELFKRNYRIISFPGCVTDFKEYMSWHKNKKVSNKISTACEGYGVVLRLESPKTNHIEILLKFINSREFIEAIAEKFDVDPSLCTYDAGLQKYLDGYEISPHPDIRKKALTYMVNINPCPSSSKKEHHTSYLDFKPKWKFINEFWNGNEIFDRCWVPWDWCEIIKQQRNNNSIVIFSPNNETLHAVKANYNHLPNQRTQLYGNLWFNECQTNGNLKWEDFVITSRQTISSKKSIKNIMSKYFPTRLKMFIKNKIAHPGTSTKTHGKRNI